MIERAVKKHIYLFSGNINTDNLGNQILLDFYQWSLHLKNCQVELRFTENSWFAANLSALLLGMVYDLRKKKNIQFSMSPENSALPDVLVRNGFCQKINFGIDFDHKPEDPRSSTVPVCSFGCLDVDKFVNYIENDLLDHRSLKTLDLQNKERIKSSYFEIFDNAGIHATQTEPLFACGQFYPQNQQLIFTLTDLGVGFLKNVKDFTQGKIKTAQEAIEWGIKGNSTKKQAVGGTGLMKIAKFCLANNGEMHIVTSGGYWLLKNKSVHFQVIQKPFIGTTIHLVF